MDIRKQRKIEFEDKCILAFVRAGRILVRTLPLGITLRLAKGLGALIYWTSKRKRVAYANLRAAFGAEKNHRELKKIARRSIQNLAMSVVELLRLPDLDSTYIHSHIKIRPEDEAKIRPFLSQGKGIIFLTAHFGSWELLNATGSLTGYPMAVLAKEQKHARADEFLNQLRSSTGTQVIYKGMAMREILRSLKKGKIVGMLSDQDGGKKGVFVRFFNRLSSSPSGVATFALRTDTPIFPVFIIRQGLTMHRVEVEGPLKQLDGVSEEEQEKYILQQFAEILEQKTRQSPDQWLWAHKRWKSTPDRSVLILSDGKAGHEQQSQAFLRALVAERISQGASAENTRSRVVEVRYRSAFRARIYRTLSLVTLGLTARRTFMVRWALSRETYESIYGFYADIIVSCGGSATPVNLYAKRLNGAKSAVIMKPGLPLQLFDVVLAPRHDKIKKSDNLFVTKHALSATDNEELKSEAQRLNSELGLGVSSKKVGILLGGDTDQMKMDGSSFEKLAEELERTGREIPAEFLVTSSRRTPVWAEDLLRRVFADTKRCPLLVIANEANRPRVVEGILGLSDVILVSLESVSMISQAVSSGKPVIVFNVFKNDKTKPKFQRFLTDLMNEEKIVPADSDTIGEVLKSSLYRTVSHGGVQDLSDESVLRAAAKRLI